MPRAFLITHRRYNANPEGEQRESSPEHKVSLPEAPTSPDAVHPSTNRLCTDESNSETFSSNNSNDCPDDLYNLTKLAEVSLAAASGKLYHHRHLSTIPVLSQNQQSDQNTQKTIHLITDGTVSSSTPSYAHKLFDRDRDRGNINESLSIAQQSGTRNHIGNSPTSTGSVSSPEPDTAHHECPDCGKRYSTSSNLARHRQTHRSLADKKARRCPHCDKVYVSMPAYSMHVRTHVQGCRCPYCGKCFSRPWLLQGHIRTHTGEKPFRCSVCQKAFADKSNLRAHVQTHSDTKPHVCQRCGKAFALKSYLYKHEESSCMRGQRSSCEQLSSPQKQTILSPTPTLPSPNLLKNHINHFTSTYHHPIIHDLSEKPTSAPTPVIVRPDRPFRSTVISPNPERAILSFVERPAAIISATVTGRCCIPLSAPAHPHIPKNPESLRACDDQPMDFSTSGSKEGYDSDKRTSNSYGIGLAIAV